MWPNEAFRSGAASLNKDLNLCVAVVHGLGARPAMMLLDALRRRTDHVAKAMRERSAFFQAFRPCLIVGPGNHTRKHNKYNEHDCAHHHGVERHSENPPQAEAIVVRGESIVIDADQIEATASRRGEGFRARQIED